MWFKLTFDKDITYMQNYHIITFLFQNLKKIIKPVKKKTQLMLHTCDSISPFIISSTDKVFQKVYFTTFTKSNFISDCRS